MRRLVIVCLVALTTSAFSNDMLTAVQGKWTLDVDATKAQAEVKKKLDAKDPETTMMLTMFASATLSFSKDSLTISAMGREQVEKFTVVKNTKDLFVFSDSAKEETTVTKIGKTIKMAPPKDSGATALIFKRP